MGICRTKYPRIRKPKDGSLSTRELLVRIFMQFSYPISTKTMVEVAVEQYGVTSANGQAGVYNRLSSTLYMYRDHLFRRVSHGSWELIEKPDIFYFKLPETGMYG